MGRAPSPNQSLGTWGRRVPPLLAHLASHSTTCRLQGPPLKGTSRFTGVTQAGLHTALGTTDPTSRAPVQHLAHSSPGGTPPLGGEVRKVEAGGAIWGQTKQEREQDTQMFRKKFPPGAPWGPLAGVERAAAQPGAQEHTRAAPTWDMGALPGTDPGRGVSGPPSPRLTFQSSAQPRAPSGG